MAQVVQLEAPRRRDNIAANIALSSGFDERLTEKRKDKKKQAELINKALSAGAGEAKIDKWGRVTLNGLPLPEYDGGAGREGDSFKTERIDYSDREQARTDAHKIPDPNRYIEEQQERINEDTKKLHNRTDGSILNNEGIDRETHDKLREGEKPDVLHDFTKESTLKPPSKILDAKEMEEEGRKLNEEYAGLSESEKMAYWEQKKLEKLADKQLAEAELPLQEEATPPLSTPESEGGRGGGGISAKDSAQASESYGLNMSSNQSYGSYGGTGEKTTLDITKKGMRGWGNNETERSLRRRAVFEDIMGGLNAGSPTALPNRTAEALTRREALNDQHNKLMAEDKDSLTKESSNVTGNLGSRSDAVSENINEQSGVNMTTNINNPRPPGGDGGSKWKDMEDVMWLDGNGNRVNAKINDKGYVVFQDNTSLTIPNNAQNNIIQDVDTIISKNNSVLDDIKPVESTHNLGPKAFGGNAHWVNKKYDPSDKTGWGYMDVGNAKQVLVYFDSGKPQRIGSNSNTIMPAQTATSYGFDLGRNSSNQGNLNE